jgi:murein L,D-transpeptidase YafK
MRFRALFFVMFVALMALPLLSFAGSLPDQRTFTPSMLLPEEDAAPADLAHVRAASILVTKSEHRLDVLDPHGRTIRSYRVSLGFRPLGPKTAEGDGRTPEGRYVIDARNEKSAYFRSLHISYPGPADIARARQLGIPRAGGSIFIHGKPNNKSPMWARFAAKYDWTNGCIAVSDNEITELWNLVPDGTPIIIRP